MSPWGAASAMVNCCANSASATLGRTVGWKKEVSSSVSQARRNWNNCSRRIRMRHKSVRIATAGRQNGGDLALDPNDCSRGTHGTS